MITTCSTTTTGRSQPSRRSAANACGRFVGSGYEQITTVSRPGASGPKPYTTFWLEQATTFSLGAM